MSIDYTVHVHRTATLGDDDPVYSRPMPDVPPVEECLSAVARDNAHPVPDVGIRHRVETRLDPATAGWAVGRPSGEPVMRYVARWRMQLALDRIRHGQHDLSGVPEPVRGVLERALDPEPARRPTLAQLSDWLDGQSASAPVRAFLGMLDAAADGDARTDMVSRTAHNPAPVWPAAAAVAGIEAVLRSADSGRRERAVFVPR